MMRLLNTKTLSLEAFVDPQTPTYAILSHTWENEEATFEHISKSSGGIHARHAKVQGACRLARGSGIEYVWVDTCCIDKSSSAELSEAINSMFAWYKRATVCYVFLSDLGANVSTEEGLSKCRWFTRGWTLQELIAPRVVRFYDSKWRFRGTKEDLVGLISGITNIHIDILRSADALANTSIATKLSWASGRNTTRVEDIAYSLLGIFNINMPMLYGEGEKAFYRLQQEISKKTNDLSLLAWLPDPLVPPRFREILAKSPSDFAWLRGKRLIRCSDNGETTITNKGFRITTRLLMSDIPFSKVACSPFDVGYVMSLGCTVGGLGDELRVGLRLQRFGASFFVRDLGDPCTAITFFQRSWVKRLPEQTIYIHLDNDNMPEWVMGNIFAGRLPPLTLTTATRLHKVGVHFPPQSDFSISRILIGQAWDPLDRMLHCGWSRTGWDAVWLQNTAGENEVMVLVNGLRTADNFPKMIDITILDSSDRRVAKILRRAAELEGGDIERLCHPEQSPTWRQEHRILSLDKTLEFKVITHEVNFQGNTDYSTLQVKVTMSKVERERFD